MALYVESEVRDMNQYVSGYVVRSSAGNFIAGKVSGCWTWTNESKKAHVFQDPAQAQKIAKASGAKWHPVRGAIPDGEWEYDYAEKKSESTAGGASMDGCPPVAARGNASEPVKARHLWRLGMKLNISPEWLRRMAENEGDGIFSVGGLVTRIDRGDAMIDLELLKLVGQSIDSIFNLSCSKWRKTEPEVMACQVIKECHERQAGVCPECEGSCHAPNPFFSCQYCKDENGRSTGCIEEYHATLMRRVMTQRIAFTDASRCGKDAVGDEPTEHIRSE